MEKIYLFNVYIFCKSLCVINVGSPYGLHVDSYIFNIYMIRCGWLGCQYCLTYNIWSSSMCLPDIKTVSIMLSIIFVSHVCVFQINIIALNVCHIICDFCYSYLCREKVMIYHIGVFQGYNICPQCSAFHLWPWFFMFVYSGDICHPNQPHPNQPHLIK